MKMLQRRLSYMLIAVKSKKFPLLHLPSLCFNFFFFERKSLIYICIYLGAQCGSCFCIEVRLMFVNALSSTAVPSLLYVA